MQNKIYLWSLVALLSFGGCQAKDKPVEQVATQEVQVSQQAAEQKNTELTRSHLSEEKIKAINERIKKKDDPRLPIPILRLTVDDSPKGMTPIDVERSFMFRKASFAFCYKLILAQDETAKGSATMSLVGKDQKVSEVTGYSDTFAHPEFESCMRSKATLWPLGEGAQIDVTLHFSSKPPISVEELRKINLANSGNPGHSAPSAPGVPPAVPDVQVSP